MPAHRGAFKVQGHPQFRQISEALVNGQSARKISSWVDPPLSFSTISIFARTIVRPTLAKADHLKSLMPDNVLQQNGLQRGATPVATLAVMPHNGATATPNNDVQVLKDVNSAIAGAPLIALRDKRVAELDDLRARLQMVVDERGEEMSVCEACGHPEGSHPIVLDEHGHTCEKFERIPGGRSGLLARDYKGKDATRTVYKVDQALLSEKRELMKQAAIELGQWQEGSGPMVAIQIVCPAAPTQVRRQSPDPEAIDISIVSK